MIRVWGSKKKKKRIEKRVKNRYLISIWLSDDDNRREKKKKKKKNRNKQHQILV